MLGGHIELLDRIVVSHTGCLTVGGVACTLCWHWLWEVDERTMREAGEERLWMTHWLVVVDEWTWSLQ